eukprot:361810-Rhodomonas_salina.3
MPDHRPYVRIGADCRISHVYQIVSKYHSLSVENPKFLAAVQNRARTTENESHVVTVFARKT